MKKHKILTINPDSTSTKIALFEEEKCIFSKNVSHDANELEKYETLAEQLPYRRDVILELLENAEVSLSDVDVFVGRGGGLIAMEGGTYYISELMLEHAKICANGVLHPASLGPQLAYEFAQKYGKKAINNVCTFIAPVSAYPGEFEMEAMASGAIRVLDGEEIAKEYTGKPVWSEFDFEVK